MPVRRLCRCSAYWRWRTVEFVKLIPRKTPRGEFWVMGPDYCYEVVSKPRKDEP